MATVSLACREPSVPAFLCGELVGLKTSRSVYAQSAANHSSSEISSRWKPFSCRQLARQLRCSKSGVELNNVQLSSERSQNTRFSASHDWHGAAPFFFGRRISFITSSRNLSRGRSRLGNSSFVCNAGADVSVSSVPEEEAQSPESVSDCGNVTNFLRRIANLRTLPALLLGLGVVLSLRPGHALAMASEALSPEGKGLLASAWAGLVAGCLHTLTGPDHLAALAPLCIGRSRMQSAAVGALWGCGHDAGQIIFGLIFLLLKDKLHIELIRTWASRVVGLTLITIGAMGIRESQEPVVFLTEEGGLQDIGGKHNITIKNDSKHATTFATGVVYGLQPDALLMILPALALPSRITGAAFLGMFLLGTVLAMGSYTLFLSSCSNALQKKLPGITKNLTLGSSLIAIALGLGLFVSEFLGVSLF